MEIVKTVSKKVEQALKNHLKNEAEVFIERIKQVIIEEYDNQLIGFKADRRSKIDYNTYRDKFVSRLNEFQFIKDNENGITLNIPDMETFDFSDGLEIVKIMMEGLGGIYIEVDEEEYSYIFGRKPQLADAVDNNVTTKDRVFLVKYTGKIRRVEKELNTRFVRFPFFNSSPIDILEVGDVFVKDNIDEWINNAIEQANKRVVNTYK